MDNLEIFDKDGKVLHIADVIYSFIKDRAVKSKKDIEDVYVGVDLGFTRGKSPVLIHTVESAYNDYDELELKFFGEDVKVNCT